MEKEEITISGEQNLISDLTGELMIWAQKYNFHCILPFEKATKDHKVIIDLDEKTVTFDY